MIESKEINRKAEMVITLLKNNELSTEEMLKIIERAKVLIIQRKKYKVKFEIEKMELRLHKVRNEVSNKIILEYETNILSLKKELKKYESL